MASIPDSPHDALFRQIFKRRPDAASEIRAALDTPLLTFLDLTHLDLQPGSYITDDLRGCASDLLFATRLTSGHPAFVYVLLEHQSRPDPIMPLRLLTYMTGIWRQYRDEHPNTRRIPAIVPIVVHSGHRRSRWNTPEAMADLYDLDQAAFGVMAGHLPQFQMILDDIAPLDLPAIRARDLTADARIVFMMHKITPGEDTSVSDILNLIEDLQAVDDGPYARDTYNAVFNYILITANITVTALQPVIDQLGPRAKEALMTTAERLRAEGRAQGKAEGRAQGKAEGRAQNAIETPHRHSKRK
ncbi:Rpn family recombination-promoting nuclease/putative transposase [Nocardia sp. NPDC058497]|uniref:Rpn family recombination-promoting nuclease/putative transposase n=1 Tax=Nocardia sp. NPDC058497 TaxID=3346529 RepID=UPI00365E396F